MTPTAQSKLKMREKRSIMTRGPETSFLTSVRQTHRMSNLDKIYFSAT